LSSLTSRPKTITTNQEKAAFLTLRYDPEHYPYPSRRTVVYAKGGMVAASQPLAAQAGLAILKKGGNAVDAAVATAACLTVVEPTSCGIGGDAFALIWHDNTLHGLNASGPAPNALSLAALQSAGHREMPRFGFTPVTVPGAPAAWAACNRRFGRLPLAEVLAPAIDYAENGYPLSPTLAQYWRLAFNTYHQHLRGGEFSHWFDTFAPGGRAPRAGEIWRSADHARTLELIAASNAEEFYRGSLAAKIEEFSLKHGGYIQARDLADYHPQWWNPSASTTGALTSGISHRAARGWWPCWP
jgi:gamma-glutamyltranspeptidase/glutathione hydrolase